jgi:hypothetical protein
VGVSQACTKLSRRYRVQSWARVCRAWWPHAAVLLAWRDGVVVKSPNQQTSDPTYKRAGGNRQHALAYSHSTDGRSFTAFRLVCSSNQLSADFDSGSRPEEVVAEGRSKELD